MDLVGPGEIDSRQLYEALKHDPRKKARNHMLGFLKGTEDYDDMLKGTKDADDMLRPEAYKSHSEDMMTSTNDSEEL